MKRGMGGYRMDIYSFEEVGYCVADSFVGVEETEAEAC
jgi:hypothetical protein